VTVRHKVPNVDSRDWIFIRVDGFSNTVIKTLTLVGRIATAFSTLRTCLGGVWVTTAHTLTLKYPNAPPHVTGNNNS